MLRDWTGDWIGTFIGHKGAVWSTKLSADGSRAVSGSADFTAKFWDTYTGSPLHSFPHDHIVRTVAISPNSSHILTGGHEKKMRLFDLARPEAEPNFFVKAEGGGTAHDGNIRSLVWDPQSAAAVSAGEDKVIRWWDLRTQQEIQTLPLPDNITSMELSAPTAKLCVTSGKHVSFVPLSLNGGPAYTLELPHGASSASLHPTLRDRFVVGSTDDPWVRVYEYESGEQREVYKGHHGPVHCVEYSPDGELYATGSEDGTIRLWQTTPGKAYGLWQGPLNGNE
jgi:serine-threonine kinase receptor-associated protein